MMVCEVCEGEREEWVWGGSDMVGGVGDLTKIGSTSNGARLRECNHVGR